jgi:hypothetical protein
VTMALLVSVPLLSGLAGSAKPGMLTSSASVFRPLTWTASVSLPAVATTTPVRSLAAVP